MGDNLFGKMEAFKAQQIETLKHHSDLPNPNVINKLAMPNAVIVHFLKCPE